MSAYNNHRRFKRDNVTVLRCCFTVYAGVQAALYQVETVLLAVGPVPGTFQTMGRTIPMVTVLLEVALWRILCIEARCTQPEVCIWVAAMQAWETW